MASNGLPSTSPVAFWVSGSRLDDRRQAKAVNAEEGQGWDPRRRGTGRCQPQQALRRVQGGAATLSVGAQALHGQCGAPLSPGADGPHLQGLPIAPASSGLLSPFRKHSSAGGGALQRHLGIMVRAPEIMAAATSTVLLLQDRCPWTGAPTWPNLLVHFLVSDGGFLNLP